VRDLARLLMSDPARQRLWIKLRRDLSGAANAVCCP